MRLIDADALVKEICKISCNKDRNACPHINSCFETGCKTVIAIENAPAVEQIQHGHWEFIGGYGYQYRCSKCFMCAPHQTNYCPACGCKMDEVSE